jgi:ribosomal protein L11 methyltransferase
MTSRGPLWKVSIRTTHEAEDAVTELLTECFGQPASSYTDVETREVTVATYLTKSALKGRQVLKRGGKRSATPISNSLHQGLKRIKSFGLDLGSAKISVQKLRRQDWAESWKRHFKPIEIGSRLLIKPSWSKKHARKDQAVIVLDPGLSFGTGQHPTTAFCLQQVAAHRSTPDPRPSTLSFLDIGTGSGILAIAAAKLGYAPVDAFDFDSEAVRIARENARNNRVARQLRIVRGDITKLPTRSAKKYDVVCANLISTLLIAERRRILARLKASGVLVLAGILKSEFRSVQTVYEHAGLRLIASRAQKEWQSGAFRRH